MTSAPVLLSWYFRDTDILVIDFVQTNGFCSANMFAAISGGIGKKKYPTIIKFVMGKYRSFVHFFTEKDGRFACGSSRPFHLTFSDDVGCTNTKGKLEQDQ
jgi:hypothetical protein